MACGIYKITNKTDGKVYVGQAIDIAHRWRLHIHSLRRGDHRNIRMQRAFNRDGEAAFEFSTIEECLPEALAAREQHWIDFFDTSYRYNICIAADSRKGVKASDETRAKLSAVKKGKIPPQIQTAESRAKATKTFKDGWHTHAARHTPEINAKRAQALRDRWALKPKAKMSDETKARMSASKQDFWARQTEEYKKAKGAVLHKGNVNG